MDSVERIRACAFQSIGRACLFGVLAIVMVVSALIAWPVVAFRAGAILTMLAGAILAIKALGARRRSYRKTETWLLLGRRHDLPEARAQDVFGAILRDMYWRFVDYAALGALGFWLLALLAWLLDAPASQHPRRPA